MKNHIDEDQIQKKYRQQKSLWEDLRQEYYQELNSYVRKHKKNWNDQKVHRKLKKVSLMKLMIDIKFVHWHHHIVQ